MARRIHAKPGIAVEFSNAKLNYDIIIYPLVCIYDSGSQPFMDCGPLPGTLNTCGPLLKIKLGLRITDYFGCWSLSLKLGLRIGLLARYCYKARAVVTSYFISQV